jgi:hypothetical protein
MKVKSVFKSLFHLVHSRSNYLIPVLLIIGTFLIYKNFYPIPRNWLDHYLYLSKSILHGKVSVDSIPEFYQDVNVFNSHKYLPFPPVPALVLVPFVNFIPNITEQSVSILLGSTNIGLIYLLLKKITKSREAVLLSIFLALGTVHFWVSLVGTSWNFAHIVSFMLLTTSLIVSIYPPKKFGPIISGVLFALAGLSRLTVIAGGLFFVINYWKRKRDLLLFLTGASIFIPVFFVYNFLRFGSFFETGYVKIYENYTKGGYGYSIQRVWFPNSEQPQYMDPKSIPYHLYTLFLMPPEIPDLNIFKSKPSPYGMGILFASPLLFLVFKKYTKNKLELQAWFGLIPVALLTFCHYAQGWVQFGYRFILDFLPFLMIILALKFKINRLTILLLAVSIIVNFWGTNWGIKLGW